jgi:L-gulonate 5-dehydrogenase
MRAVVMRAFGGADVLELDEVADPALAEGEALVRVGAVEVSSTRDVATRTGRHPFSRQVASLPHVLGGDFAGVVEDVGPGVDRALVGRRVAASNTRTCGTCPACRAGDAAACPSLSILGIHRWGSYAELATVPAAALQEIPDDLSLSEAAAMAATGPIALTQLTVGRVEPGTWVLVTGATGALGTAIAALGVRMGARVVALSRRPQLLPEALPYAARLDGGDEDLGQRLMEVTGGDGIEVAVDNVANGDVFGRYFPSLQIGGRIVISGAIGRDRLPVLPVPASPFYVRSLSLLGVRTTSPRDIARFWTLVREGFRLPGEVLHELPFDAAAEAHARIENGAALGHTLLTVPGP